MVVYPLKSSPLITLAKLAQESVLNVLPSPPTVLLATLQLLKPTSSTPLVTQLAYLATTLALLSSASPAHLHASPVSAQSTVTTLVPVDPFIAILSV